MFRVIVFVVLMLRATLGHAEPTSYSSYTRETDYTIGSVAHQTLVVNVPRGYRLDEGSLPETGVTEAIELRALQWTIEETPTKARYVFSIDWQIFVAAETVKSVPLRSLSLVFKRNAEALTVVIPPDSVLVSNLLPPKMDAKHVQPYPDVLPPMVTTWPLTLTFCSAFIVLCLSSVYLAWYMGWICLPSERRMPFRQAWRAIRRLNEDASSTLIALRALSQAFSQYAGYSVTRETVSRMLAERSALAPYRHEIEQLYDDIQQTFFAGQPAHHTVGTLKTLAKQISRVELS